MSNLSSDVLITEALATTAAGTSTITGTEIDMQNYESVLFIAKFGTAASDNTLHAEQDTVTGMASAQDLLGTETGVGASDEIVWLDLVKPLERFVRVMADRGTSSTLDWGVAIRYNGIRRPADNTVAGTIHGEVHVSPAEGTK